MASATVTQALPGSPACDRLSMMGATFFPHPLPQQPAVLVLILAGTRSYEVLRGDGGYRAGGYRATIHLELGERATLVEDADLETAYAAVERHLTQVAEYPAGWSVELDRAVAQLIHDDLTAARAAAVPTPTAAADAALAMA